MLVGNVLKVCQETTSHICRWRLKSQHLEGTRSLRLAVRLRGRSAGRYSFTRPKGLSRNNFPHLSLAIEIAAPRGYPEPAAGRPPTRTKCGKVFFYEA